MGVGGGMVCGCVGLAALLFVFPFSLLIPIGVVISCKL